VCIDIDEYQRRKSYVAYGLAPTPTTLSDLEGHFCCLKPFSLPYLANIASVNYNVFTYMNLKVNVAYNFDCLIEIEGRQGHRQSRTV